MCLQWGSGRLCGRSWGGRVVVPPGKGLGCLERGPCCCRCSTGSSTIGLLDAVELRWFVRVQVLHSVLVSNLGSLFSCFWEMPANPSHATALVTHFARPQALFSVLTLPPGLCFLQEGEDSRSLFTQSLYLRGSYKEGQDS